MYTADVNKSETYYEHCVPSMMMSSKNPTTVDQSGTFLPINYSDHPAEISPPSYQQQAPMNIYNNFNHHHYYYPNFQDYAYQSSIENNWIRKYDCESQKEYFMANTPPTPSDYCDFEVPQQQIASVKSTAKILSDADKFYYDNSCKSQKDHASNNNNIDYVYNSEFWESEKISKKSSKSDEKLKKSEHFRKDDKKIAKNLKDIDIGKNF